MPHPIYAPLPHIILILVPKNLVMHVIIAPGINIGPCEKNNAGSVTFDGGIKNINC